MYVLGGPWSDQPVTEHQERLFWRGYGAHKSTGRAGLLPVRAGDRYVEQFPAHPGHDVDDRPFKRTCTCFGHAHAGRTWAVTPRDARAPPLTLLASYPYNRCVAHRGDRPRTGRLDPLERPEPVAGATTLVVGSRSRTRPPRRRRPPGSHRASALSRRRTRASRPGRGFGFPRVSPATGTVRATGSWRFGPQTIVTAIAERPGNDTHRASPRPSAPAGHGAGDTTPATRTVVVPTSATTPCWSKRELRRLVTCVSRLHPPRHDQRVVGARPQLTAPTSRLGRQPPGPSNPSPDHAMVPSRPLARPAAPPNRPTSNARTGRIAA